jgi:uncharacterized protein YegP (UPF0339 family)
VDPVAVRVAGGQTRPSTIPRAGVARGANVAGKGEIYKRADGQFGFRVKASNGEQVASDGGQGYSNKADAKSTLEKLLKGGYDGPITEVE